MVEQWQDVKIKLVVETNKATYTKDFEIDDYGDILDLLDSLIETVNDRLGTSLSIQDN